MIFNFLKSVNDNEQELLKSKIMECTQLIHFLHNTAILNILG